MPKSSSAVVFFAALIALGLPACTLATASTGFEEYGGPLRCGTSGPVRDLDVRLTGFSAHGMNTVLGDVVRIGATPADRTLVGRFVLDPGQISDPVVTLPCLLAEGQYEIDLLADIDNDGLASCPPIMGDPRPECRDHQWRLEVQGDGALAYMHDLRFEDVSIDAGIAPTGSESLDITLQNVRGFEGLALEVHVRRLLASPAGPIRQTVYMHRLAAIPMSDPTVEGSDTIVLPRPGTIARNLIIAAPETDYEIVFWIDRNRNGTYERPNAPGGGGTDRDVSWSTTIRTDVGGLHPVFDATGPEALIFVDAQL